ncbi:MAG: glycine cleavage system aminomethyltransferase GcvT [Rhodospirillales bacterium]|nr:glycine cleavage system aminomethyltransferase GcvT [Rhodospirillales bacterium]
MGEQADAPLKRTPLYDLHCELGAKMVPFAGYEMPVQFKGILSEHLHAREKAVLFDVSHMGQMRIDGEAADALESLVVADVKGLPVGKVRYTLFTNAAGGIIDDLMITQGGYYLMLVVNAARKAVDFAHLRDRLPGFDIHLLNDMALLALQGPAAASVLSRLAPASKVMLFMTSEALKIGDIRCIVSRTGYTGEDGFEISCAASEAEALARMLLAEPEVMPAGLGARDTLRLEAGLCLWGNDIDETTTPVEAGLNWAISRRRREEGGFPGDEIILRQLFDGAPRKRVGIRLAGKVPARRGSRILDGDGRDIGVVTSGGYAPSVGGPIAMGYVTPAVADVGTSVQLVVRDKPLQGEVVLMPFIEQRYVK